MQDALIEKMKTDIEEQLKNFLREEGLELCVAANDNPPPRDARVVLEGIDDAPLEGPKLLSEIRVILGVLGKPWQCDALVEGIYHALHPHRITVGELTVLLMSVHVESMHCLRPRQTRKRTVMRYIVERE